LVEVAAVGLEALLPFGHKAELPVVVAAEVM
jgi:hypothetical protein